MQDVVELVKVTIKKILNNDELIITDKTDLINDLGMDSISLMMLVVEIEEMFQIVLPDDFFNIDNLSHFDSIVLLIEGLLLSKRQSEQIN